MLFSGPIKSPVNRCNKQTYGRLRQQRIHLQCGRPRFNPWVGTIPWTTVWQPTSVFLPGESPWTDEPGGLQPIGCKQSDMTEAAKHSTALVAQPKRICLECRSCRRHRFNPWVGKILWRRRQPTPVFLPGKSHGQRYLVDYSP